MKRMFTILLVMVGLSAAAQTRLPAGSYGSAPSLAPAGSPILAPAVSPAFAPAATWGYGFSPLFSPLPNVVTFPTFDASRPNRWLLKPFASVSAGYLFYNGGGASYLSAPAGLALFRPLNPNWTLFGAATISPTVLSTNRWTAPISDPNYHGYPWGSANGLGITTGIQGGLMYTNQDKTFSISGSVHVERSSYPVYPVAPSRK